MTGLRIPLATYRLQFNSRFRFEDARGLVPYLAALGITDVYASPIFQARKGSEHGYDITNPQKLNPELGAEQDFDDLVVALKAHGMGLVQDFAPNHMSANYENPWWMDVLENGPSSPYVLYFDVNWQPAGPLTTEEKVLLPVLGQPYGTVLENAELKLSLDEHGFWVNYYQNKFPLGTRTYNSILSFRLEELEQALGKAHPSFQQLFRLIEVIEQLPPRTITDPEELKIRLGSKENVKQRLWQIYSAHPEMKNFLDENILIYNGRKGDARSFDRLDQLLDAQPYRLAYWRVAADRVAYRRFFDVSDLVSIHPEVPQVFQEFHSLILRLIAEGKITGVRIDHLDGLYDPLGYLIRLQTQINPDAAELAQERGCTAFYVVIEKILLNDEQLPEEWPVCGTTGYDFAGDLNGVMVDGAGLESLQNDYARMTGINVSFEEMVYQKKKQVIQELFSGETRALCRRLIQIAEVDRHARDLNPDDLTHALIENIASFPVYRTYSRAGEMSASDRACIEESIANAARRNPQICPRVFEYLRHVLLLEAPPTLNPRQREAWVRFVARWQQFTSPIMAKGLEDTALYVYNRLVSLNEVGGKSRALPVEAFHAANRRRYERWPHSMNATSTHDTKRSEDVRARINVISEMPKIWGRHLREWRRWNARFKSTAGGERAPDVNDEFFLYQTLLGAWPLDDSELPEFAGRIKAYMTKAMREAKVHTSWIHQNSEYEEAVLRFAEAVITPSEHNRFLPPFLRFQRRIAFYGALASLSQLLLKIASPGVPDFYQGAELWDFSLVDPDNRRPVDFVQRRQMLDDLARRGHEDSNSLLSDLLAGWRDGRIKLYVTSKSLAFRRAESELFQQGEYVPLSGSQPADNHLIAFARQRAGSWALVAVPRFVAALTAPGKPPLGTLAWGENVLALPGAAPRQWRNILTNDMIETACDDSNRPTLRLSEVFRRFPVALLASTGR